MWPAQPTSQLVWPVWPAMLTITTNQPLNKTSPASPCDQLSLLVWPVQPANVTSPASQFVTSHCYSYWLVQCVKPVHLIWSGWLMKPVAVARKLPVALQPVAPHASHLLSLALRTQNWALITQIEHFELLLDTQYWDWALRALIILLEYLPHLLKKYKRCVGPPGEPSLYPLHCCVQLETKFTITLEI